MPVEELLVFLVEFLLYPLHFRVILFLEVIDMFHGDGIARHGLENLLITEVTKTKLLRTS